MRIKITVPFEIAGWEEIRTEETPEGAKLSEVKVTKKFAGELQGTSVATVLLCGSNDESGGGYIAFGNIVPAGVGNSTTCVAKSN
jgi:hypothetical protein